MDFQLEKIFFGRKFNEIVIDQESQVVPIFLIELDKSNFSTLARHILRETSIQNSLINTDNDSLPIDDDNKLLISTDDITIDDRSDQVHLDQANQIIPETSELGEINNLLQSDDLPDVDRTLLIYPDQEKKISRKQLNGDDDY